MYRVINTLHNPDGICDIYISINRYGYIEDVHPIGDSFISFMEPISAHIPNMSTVYELSHQGYNNDSIYKVIIAPKDIMKTINILYQGVDIPITIGADPELEISNGDKYIPACEIISDEDRTARVGLDGCSDTAELRPFPAYNPQRFIHNLDTLIHRISCDYGNYYWYVNSEHVPCGGHIHIGLDWCRELVIEQRLLRFLDKIYGIRLMCMAGSARTDSDYSSPTASRTQEWGIEYRTPSAIWIHNPVLAEAVIELTYLAVKMFFSTGIPEISEIEYDYGTMSVDDLWEKKYTFKELKEFFPEWLVNKFKEGIDLYKNSSGDVVEGWGYNHSIRRRGYGTIRLNKYWDAERAKCFEGVYVKNGLTISGYRQLRGLAIGCSNNEWLSSLYSYFQDIGYTIWILEGEMNKICLPRIMRAGIYRWQFIQFLHLLADALYYNYDYEIEEV